MGGINDGSGVLQAMSVSLKVIIIPCLGAYGFPGAGVTTLVGLWISGSVPTVAQGSEPVFCVQWFCGIALGQAGWRLM